MPACLPAGLGAYARPIPTVGKLIREGEANMENSGKDIPVTFWCVPSSVTRLKRAAAPRRL